MAVMILDPIAEREIRRDRQNVEGSKWDEVWEGVLVVPPLPGDEHQEIQTNLIVPLVAAVAEPQEGKVRAGVNVSDRADGWLHNYRCPDVVVYLNGNPAVNHGTHWQGGPDFLVEILSEGEEPYAKFEFYANVNTREVLLVFRDPWAVELHRLDGGRLVRAGRSDPADPAVLASATVPLTFQLRDGTPRPTVQMTHAGTGQTWVA